MSQGCSSSSETDPGGQSWAREGLDVTPPTLGSQSHHLFFTPKLLQSREGRAEPGGQEQKKVTTGSNWVW